MGLLRSAAGKELVINVVLPWLIYMRAEAAMGRVHALMLAALPPVVWSAVQLALKRRLDALSLLVIAGIALSLLAFLGGGSFRVLELREHLATGLMGVVFLGSVAVRRPLLPALLRSVTERQPQANGGKTQALLANPRRLRFLTLAIGCLLLVETAVAILLVFTLPVREFLLVGPILNYTILGIFAAAVFWAKRRWAQGAAAAPPRRMEPNR